MKKIWVVEMYYDGEWRPTVGVGLTRSGARMEIRLEKFYNPDDKFRVRPYFSCIEEIAELKEKITQAFIAKP